MCSHPKEFSRTPYFLAMDSSLPKTTSALKAYLNDVSAILNLTLIIGDGAVWYTGQMPPIYSICWLVAILLLSEWLPESFKMKPRLKQSYRP
jgi:hypothetical protein